MAHKYQYEYFVTGNVLTPLDHSLGYEEWNVSTAIITPSLINSRHVVANIEKLFLEMAQKKVPDAYAASLMNWQLLRKVRVKDE